MSSAVSQRRDEMNYQAFKLFYALLPKIPLIIRVALYHVLRLSEQAKYLDLRSELVVSVVRSFAKPSKPSSISAVQKFSMRDPGIKGRIWVAKVSPTPPPEKDVRDSLLEALDGLRDSTVEKSAVRVPDLVSVEAEWTGYRASSTANSELPAISEKDKFDELCKECTSPVTTLYFHGGAYYLLDPAIYRPTTKKLAKLTGGRCYSVRYRLAPQNPFPSALLDALVAYMTLLYPPPDSFHEPVKPEHIVFSGDRYVFIFVGLVQSVSYLPQISNHSFVVREGT
jgi:hypothetical protein